MNEMGLIVLEVAARATALALVGLAAVSVLKRRGPSAGALAGSTTLAVLVGVAVLAPFSWPRWWSPGEAIATAPLLVSSTFQRRSTTTAGYGSCCFSMKSSACRMGASASAL